MKGFNPHSLLAFIFLVEYVIDAFANAETAQTIEFHECNSTEESIINEAWKDALQMVQSVGTLSSDDNLTLDWWGPPTWNKYWLSEIQKKYWDTEKLLLMAPGHYTGGNSTLSPKVYCGDAPGERHCAQFADVELAIRDPSAGFYSYNAGGKNYTSGLELVFCDTFFDPRVMMPLQFLLNKHSETGDLDYYWMNHGENTLVMSWLLTFTDHLQHRNS